MLLQSGINLQSYFSTCLLTVATWTSHHHFKHSMSRTELIMYQYLPLIFLTSLHAVTLHLFTLTSDLTFAF